MLALGRSEAADALNAGGIATAREGGSYGKRAIDRGAYGSLYSKSSIHGHSDRPDVAAPAMAKRIC